MREMSANLSNEQKSLEAAHSHTCFKLFSALLRGRCSRGVCICFCINFL